MKGLVQRRSASLFLIATALGGFSPATMASTSTASDTAARPAAEATPAIAGVISVDGSVSLNGVATRNGATVMSGSTITTAAGATARVDLAGLGRLDFGPGTVASVSFREREILVALGAPGGSVRPIVAPGVRARVVTSTGATSEVTAPAAAPTAPPLGARRGGLGMRSIVGLATAAVGATATVVAVAKSGDGEDATRDVSPSGF